MESKDGSWEPPSHYKASLKKAKKGLRQKTDCSKPSNVKEQDSKIKTGSCKKFNFSKKKSVVAGLKCRIEGCSKRFSQHKGRKKHEDTVHRKISFPCSYPNCTESFFSDDNKSRHEQEVHEKSLRFDCFKENCSKSFLRNETLEKHLESHSKNLFFCPVLDCLKAFVKKESIPGHIERTHKEKDHKPEDHKAEDHKPEDYRPRCECGQIFTSPGNCTNHRKSCKASEIYVEKEKSAKKLSRKSFSLKTQRKVVNILTAKGVTETPLKSNCKDLLNEVYQTVNVSPKTSIRIFKKRRSLFTDKSKAARNFTPVRGESKEDRVRRVFGPLKNKNLLKRTNTNRKMEGQGRTQDPKWLQIEERMLEHFLFLREDFTARVSIATMIEVLMKAAAELGYDLAELVSKTKNPTAVLYDRVYRFLIKYNIRLRNKVVELESSLEMLGGFSRMFHLSK